MEPEHQGRTLFARPAAEGEVEHHGGSFKKYMVNKNQKLQEQFEEQSAAVQATAGQQTSDLFRGISIHVNGLTTPSLAELRQIMALHGGTFVVNYARAAVTHIICSHLTDRKVQLFKKMRDPRPIVRPDWIVDSLKAGEVLPPEAPAPVDPASAEYRLAQERASAARAACDLLRGRPKTSNEDPYFMDSYYRSSRLSFIGRWKQRFELMHAQQAEHAPQPPSMQQSAQAAAAQLAVIHLDMDCFFASVAELSDPVFKGKPLAVCHSNNAQGSAEISSANYEARKYGINAGMFMARAKALCPHLIVLPYDFDKYEAIALSIRQEIKAATGCTASAGISCNKLLAKLATNQAKPDGQFFAQDLPGVGPDLSDKLAHIGVRTVLDVRLSSKDALQRACGTTKGAQVWATAHGRDDRPVEPPKHRKSVGAECNWGIRFTCDADALTFLDQQAVELSSRMQAVGVKGRTVTLKIMRRKANAPEPPKFMGHGSCDSFTRSKTLARYTDAPADLAREGKDMLLAMRLDATQIRGIGLNVTKLDTDTKSASARPGAAAPAKGAAPPPTAHNPHT
eukprot:jgi/Astpho2/2603/e_gw1.00048.8.1_t